MTPLSSNRGGLTLSRPPGCATKAPMKSTGENARKPLSTPEPSHAGPTHDSLSLPSRRDFLKLSAAALAAGATQPLVGAEAPSASTPAHSNSASGKDPYALAARFNRFLRVTDVTDGLDAVGRADLTLLDPAIRPLWMGMRFWGPAVTMRVVPTNRRMPILQRKDALKQHAIWDQMGGMHAQLAGQARLRRRHLDQRRARVRLLGVQQLDGHAGPRGGGNRHRRLRPRHR